MKHFISILSFITLVASEPLNGWHKSKDGSLFYIETEAKYNWFDAWNACARKNMSLIDIDTLEKHNQIDTLLKQLYPNCPSFWLAGHDNANDERYEWATTGKLFTFTNWGPGQPDRLNNNEHCILIWENTWQWYDLPCSNKLGLICEEHIFAKKQICKNGNLNQNFNPSAVSSGADSCIFQLFINYNNTMYSTASNAHIKRKKAVP